MENLSELEQHFVHECKPFVKAILEYSGDDPIEPWYNYLLWIEERYEVHMDKTIFGPVLRAFLEQYQYKKEFHQDRRFIKGFFYYVRYYKTIFESFTIRIQKRKFVALSDCS